MLDVQNIQIIINWFYFKLKLSSSVSEMALLQFTFISLNNKWLTSPPQIFGFVRDLSIPISGWCVSDRFCFNFIFTICFTGKQNQSSDHKQTVKYKEKVKTKVNLYSWLLNKRKYENKFSLENQPPNVQI